VVFGGRGIQVGAVMDSRVHKKGGAKRPNGEYDMLSDSRRAKERGCTWVPAKRKREVRGW
jgi:hypothetical protein